MSTDHGAKYQPQRQRVLELLSDCREHTSLDMERVGGSRFGARVKELRRLGYSIESLPHVDGRYHTYRLESLEPGEGDRKRVRVLLDEEDAALLVAGHVTPGAMAATNDGLCSFQENRGKL